MAEGKENDRKQTRNKNGENDSSSAEEGKSNRHLSRKRKPEGDNRIAEEDYRGTSWSHRLDDRKSRRDRQDSDGRDKSIENGMISEEEKGDTRYSESRRDPEKRDAKYSGSRWSRYGNDHDQHRNHGHRNEGSKKQSGKSDLSGTVDKTEENDGKDQDNDQPSLNREQWLKTGLDDKQNYTARSKYKNVDKEIDRRNSRFENRDKENDIGRSKYEDSDTENDRRISRRFDDRSGNSDRKRSRDESYTGRGRPEEDENHQEKRRHCSDDKITWDGSEQNMDRDSRKRSRRREDDDVRDGRARHEEKQRHKHASKTDSNVKIGRQENERNDDGAPKKRTGEVGGEDKSMEFQKRQSPAFSARNGEAANNEKAVGRSGGVYIPPFKLAQMMKDVQDKSSPEYQRLTWDALRKSINGLVNKVNASNIKNIIPELFAENLIRGRGLFCRSCMKSQMASPGFTDVFAALVAVVNTKFPEVGSLLLRRIILQLKRAFKRNDKHVLLAAAKFIAHLVNQQVAHEIIALELLTVLLENPTDDSVEVAVGFVKECGSLLQDISPQGLHGIFERFRGILHEGEIDKRVQFLIEGLFAIRKAKFQGFPAVRPELDLVEQEDQFTHEYSLEDELDQEVALDIFKPDPEFLEHEKAYENLKKDILGEESSDEVEGENNSEEDSDDDEDEEEEDEEMLRIKDETETNLINLRRTIYLTIMSSVDFEEAGHKLLKIKLEPGQEMELCIMLLECCSQERTYLRYYGLLGQRFCMINKIYQEFFDKCFVQQYSMIHRLETNKLRNVAKFFAHLLGTDALPWHALAYIRLTEEDTTSSSRIFIKILFQELAEQLGIRKLNERLNDPTMQDSFDSIFPKDNPKNSRFAINFFTSIGLGGITESLREYLKNMPRLIMQQQKPISESDASSSSEDESGSPTSSSESDSSDSDSDSESESESDSETESETERNKRKTKRRN